MSNIILAGFGFVGKAYHNAFKNHHNISVVDPKLDSHTVKDFLYYEGIIVCVPTPQSDDGSCDMSYVFSVIKQVPEDMPIMIKSTISLEGWEELSIRFPNHAITFSPEFLRAATANEDVLATKNIIVAGGNVDFWKSVYSAVFHKASIYETSVEEAILIKYFRNSFLATKVSYFNQVFDFCNELGADFSKVRLGIALDDRIGDSHTYVSSSDRGFGGYCFPKDTAAILSTSELFNVDLSVIEAAVEYNNRIRND